MTRKHYFCPFIQDFIVAGPQEFGGQDIHDFNRNSSQDSYVFNRTSAQALCGHQNKPDLHRTPFQKFCCQDTQDFSHTSFPDSSDQDTLNIFTNSFSNSCEFQPTFSQEQIYGERGTTGVAYNQEDIVSSLITTRTLSQDTGACYNIQEFSVDMVALHEGVFASGLPNCRGLRIPLVSKLIIPQWRSYLSDYHDNVIVDYLEFGWLVGYDYE